MYFVIGAYVRSDGMWGIGVTVVAQNCTSRATANMPLWNRTHPQVDGSGEKVRVERAIAHGLDDGWKICSDAIRSNVGRDIEQRERPHDG